MQKCWNKVKLPKKNHCGESILFRCVRPGTPQNFNRNLDTENNFFGIFLPAPLTITQAPGTYWSEICCKNVLWSDPLWPVYNRTTKSRYMYNIIWARMAMSLSSNKPNHRRIPSCGYSPSAGTKPSGRQSTTWHHIHADPCIWLLVEIPDFVINWSGLRHTTISVV